MADYNDVPIGSLRWLVTVGRRAQTANAGNGITEVLSNQIDMHADIQPAGALTFWGGQQVDTPVTHKIRLRWLPYLDNTYAIIRKIELPDGTGRTETYRIRRIKEIGGRKRFVEIEAELEASS